MLGDAVHRARRPCAVAVAAQVERVDVIVLAQSACDAIPVAGVIQSAVDQDQRRLAVLPVIPKMQLQTIGVEEV
jgi:hypothetical protein